VLETVLYAGTIDDIARLAATLFDLRSLVARHSWALANDRFLHLALVYPVGPVSVCDPPGAKGFEIELCYCPPVPVLQVYVFNIQNLCPMPEYSVVLEGSKKLTHQGSRG
jgi:hypothetical protein